MKIAIQILYSKSWQDIADITIPVMDSYCYKHGYYQVVGTYEEPFSGFEKLIQIKRLFDSEGYDAIWSLDCDALISNHTYKIEDFMDDEHDAYFTNDINGLNCGSFVIKKSEWSLAFLDDLISRKDKPEMECEQNAVRAYMEDGDDPKICILSHPSINSVPYDFYSPSFGKWGYKHGDVVTKPKHEDGNWKVGDFVIHLPGMGLKKRIDVLKSIPILK